MMDDFTIYANGICHCSVCTVLTAEEATRRVNLENPTGVGSWQIAEKGFSTGEPNPCPCDTHPKTHTHYLFTC